MRKSMFIIGVFFLFAMLFNACGDTGSSQQAVTTPVPTVKAQPAKPKSTAYPTAPGPAILGATLGTFVAKFGQPNQFSQPKNALYDFSIYGNNKDDITVFMIDGKHVDSVIYAAPAKGWNESTAIAICLALLPPDAKYKRQIPEVVGGSVQGIQRVYVSPSLGNVFPAGNFTDENGNQTTPGTVGMILDYDNNSTTSFIQCTVQVGLQS